MHKKIDIYKRLTFIDEQILMNIRLYDFMIYNLHQYFCNLQKHIHTIQKKTMETRIIKNIFNNNEKRCRDVKTQKACEQN